MIELEIMAVRRRRDNPDIYNLFLRETGGTRTLQIDLTRFDAERIAGLIHNVRTLQPQPAHFVDALLKALGAEVREVHLAPVPSQQGMLATLRLDGPNSQNVEVTARPADAISIALVRHVPILIAAANLEDAAASRTAVPIKDLFFSAGSGGPPEILAAWAPGRGLAPSFPARLRLPLAITNVTVVPMDSPHPKAAHTVVIEGGTITTVAPTAEVPTDGLQIVDGTDKFLMPALADMHVHFWDLGEAALFLANGVTLVRNMWGAPIHLAARAAVERGDLAGPRIVTTSPLIDGADERGRTIWPGSPRVTDADPARALVRLYADQGYQQVKVYSWLTLETLRALCAAAADAGLRVTGHCPDGVSFEEAISAGMYCFEHLVGIGHGHLHDGFELPGLRLAADKMEARLAYTRMLTEQIDLDAIRRLASTMAASQVWSCPTNVVYQGFGQRRAEVLADPDMRYMLEPTVRRWAPPNDRFTEWSDERRSQHLAILQANADLHVQLTGILHEEGAPILLGTDTPNPFVLPGFSVHDELRNLIRAGFSPYEVLRSGTTEAARFLGESTTWGTLQPGQRADALLLSADPLHSVDALRKLEAVFVNGFMLSRSGLDQLLADRRAAIRPGS